MDKERLDDWLFSVGLGISVAVVLALAHVTYGIHFMNLTPQDIARLDSYVFFLSYASLGLLTTMFWYLKKDISSSIGILLSGIWALTSGFQDITVYVLLGYFRNTYPWLTETLPGLTAYIFNTEVTTFMLFYNTTIFGIILLGTSYYLFKYEDRIWGIEI